MADKMKDNRAIAILDKAAAGGYGVAGIPQCLAYAINVYITNKGLSNVLLQPRRHTRHRPRRRSQELTGNDPALSLGHRIRRRPPRERRRPRMPQCEGTRDFAHGPRA